LLSCEGRIGNRDQWHRWSALVKPPDRLEAAHIGHEDIDDHQLERCVVEGGETVDAAIGDRNPKTVPLEPSPNGEADMRIVIDNLDAAHHGLLRRALRGPAPPTLIAL
jgi:hypothetical protein